MNNIEDALAKVHGLIEKRKTKFQNMGEPTIHKFEDGVAFLNYFDTWDDSIAEGVKRLSIKNIGNVPEDKVIEFVFSKKGTHIPLTNFNVKKTYILLRGKINFFFEVGDDVLLVDYSSTIACKGIMHGGDTLEDSFVIVIKDNCECEA